jgi:hypothetical protein
MPSSLPPTLIDALRAELRRARVDAGIDSTRALCRRLGLKNPSKAHTPYYNLESGNTGWGTSIEKLVHHYAVACGLDDATIWRRAVYRWAESVKELGAEWEAAWALREAEGAAEHHATYSEGYSSGEKKRTRMPSAKRRQ